MLFRLMPLIAGVLLIAVPVTSAQQRKWICVAEQATGFACRDRQWVPTSFAVTDKRYLIAVDTLSGRYGVTEFGQQLSTPCEAAAPTANGWIICESIYLWRINVVTLKYVKIYPIGYAEPVPDPCENAPHIEIGKCSPF